MTGVRRDLLDSLLVGGQVPVVAPLARDEEGVVCNVNADDAAAGIAAGLGARQLVLMTDVDGVRDATGRKLDTITVAEAEALIADGTISGGMVPKVKAALAALAWEGAEAIIADGVRPGRPRPRARRPDVRHPRQRPRPRRRGVKVGGRCSPSSATATRRSGALVGRAADRAARASSSGSCPRSASR